MDELLWFKTQVAKMSRPYSIVVESANLGMSEFDSLRECLTNLKRQIASVEGCRELVILLTSKLTDDQEHTLRTIAPEAILHRVTEPLAYLFFKLEGVQYCTGEFVCFVDMDVELEANHLEQLFEVFDLCPDAEIASSYVTCKHDSAYEVAMASSWMIRTLPREEIISEDYNFPLNNFVVRRDILMKNLPKPNKDFYRGAGMIWKKALHDRGHRSYIRADAAAVHEVPDFFPAGLVRIMAYAADRVPASQYYLDDDNRYAVLPSTFLRIKTFFGFNFYNITKAVRSIRFLWHKEEVPRARVLLALPMILFNLFVIVLVSFVSIVSNQYFVRLVRKHEF